MSDYRIKNRERLINTISLVNGSDKKFGWTKSVDIAVGGLQAIGFSKIRTNLLLVLSSTGRSVIDCDTGEKIERSYTEYEGLDESGLYCNGIGDLASESLLLSGIYGGGLPHQNSIGESIELVAPAWPEYDLIFCKQGKGLYSEPGSCYKLDTNHFRAFGMSWCGNYIAAGTGSDLYVWARDEKL